MPTPPQITPLPAAPSRAEGPVAFNAKADPFIAALPPFVLQANLLASAINDAILDITNKAESAASSANAAATSAGQALNSQSAAAVSAQTAQIAAAASGASAGIGQLGNAGDSLQVNGARTGLVFGPSDGKVGDVLISSRNPGSLFFPANGSIRSQLSSPTLFAALGLINGQIGQTYSSVSTGSGLAPTDIASAPGNFPSDPPKIMHTILMSSDINFSSDGGLTWSIKPGSYYASSSATLSYDEFNSAWIKTDGLTVVYSDNESVSWNTVSIPVAFSKIVPDFNGVWVGLPTASSTVIYRSTNKGATWAAITTGVAAVHSAAATNNSGVWCIAAGATVRRSIDGGLSWATAYTSSAALQAIANDGSGVWLVSGASSNTNTYKSVDNGLTFTLLGTPATSTVTDVSYTKGFFFLARSVSPQLIMISSAADATVYTLPSTAVLASLSKVTARMGYVVAINTANSNTLRSAPNYSYDSATQFHLPNLTAADGLRAWIKAGNKLVSSGRMFSTGVALDINPTEIATDGKGVIICVSTTGAIRRSKDFGANWETVSSPVADNLTTIATNLNGLWLIGSGAGSLLRSTDNGVTFALITNHGFSGNISQLVIGLNDVVVGCMSGNAAPRRSTDGGLTWVNLAAASTATVICTDRLGNWVLAQNSNTRRSNNNAVSFFTALATDLPLPPTDIKMNRDGFVYLCSNSSLACRSSDYGQSWSNFSIILGTTSPKFKVGEGQIVTVYSTASSLFRCSLNKGSTWLAPSPVFTPYCIAGGVDSPFIAVSTSGSVFRTATLDTPI